MGMTTVREHNFLKRSHKTMAEKQTNKERLREITDGIAQGIKALFQSDKYRSYLSVMSRFHRYSVNNTMLIYLQRPDATLVAGYEKWKKQFGRHVKQGERGITILAPTPFKKRIEEVKLDPDTKAPLLDKDGNQITEEREISIPMFKPVKVFDVAQTDGRPLPNLASALSGNVEQYEVFVEALRRSAPVPISFRDIAKDTDGYFSPSDQAITIREGMSEVQTISALVHEIAHSKLHNYERQQAEAAAGEESGEPVKKDRHTEEVEAESVSYAVCQYFGIETAENSFGYIASWSQGKALKELRASLETINQTASALITDVERNFAELCKERGNDPKALPEQEVPGPETPSPDTRQAFAAELCDHQNPFYADAPRLQEIEHSAMEESAALLDTYPMPDDSVRMGDLEDAGYLDGDMLPISRDRACEMMEQGFPVYGIVDGGTAELCLDSADIDAHPMDTLFSVPKEEWEESQSFGDKIRERMDRQEEREAAFLACPGDAYAIYQLKHTDELRTLRYESLDRLERMGQQPQRSNYDLVYTRAGLPDGQSPEAILGKLWEDFNIHRPADYHAPSLSVSDILAIQQGDEVSYHYCDSVGFQKLPGFNQPENYMKAAEMAMEDDYGMIDGILNNGSRQATLAELEAQVKAGQTISLMDLAAAVKAEPKARPRGRSPKGKEEKLSILDRLKQPLPKQTKKSAPQRRAEKELI